MRDTDLPDDLDEELLPEGASLDSGPEQDFNLDDLRVDFSDQEASSEARDFTPLPGGKYRVAVTDVETKFSKSQKNPGKPFYAMTLTVQEGPFENRKLFANVMLFNGALYSLVQIMKAMGWRAEGQGVKPPKPDDLMGQTFIVSVKKIVDKYRAEQDSIDIKTCKAEDKPFKNEIGAFFKDGQAVNASAGADSMLP